MGWFEEQIRQKIKVQNRDLDDALMEMAEIVVSDREMIQYNDERIVVNNAVQELLRFYHKKELQIPESVTGTEQILDYVCSTAGLMRREVRLEEGWYRHLTGAMLGMLKDSQTMVAILPGSTGKYYYFNAQTGRKVKLNRKTEQEISREAYCFYAAFPEQSVRKKDIKRFVRQNIFLPDVVRTCVSVFIAMLLGLMLSPLTQILYSTVLPGGRFAAVAALLVFMLAVKLSQSSMDMLKDLNLKKITSRLQLNVQAAGMIRILGLPTSFFRNYTAGDLSSRVDLFSDICDRICRGGLTVLTAIVYSVAYLIQIIVVAPSLAMPVVVQILLTGVLFFLIYRARSRNRKEILEGQVAETGLVYSILSAINKIRLSGGEKIFFTRWAKTYKKLAASEFNLPFLLKISQVVPVMVSLGILLYLYISASLSDVPKETWLAFMACYGLITGALQNLTDSLNDLSGIAPIRDMLRPLVSTVSENAGHRKHVSKLIGTIEVNNVSFSYQPETPNILKHLSLKIKKGEYVAIVGKTGCGKSTLLRLLLGFEKPKSGRIYFDGAPLDTLDLRSLRQNIGTVTQDGRLFLGDIFSNIVICKPTLTMDEAWEAAQLAGIADDIRRMPMGMHTLISEDNGGISGGQRQRLMIARAIAHKPSILFFDEATSALDNISQKIVSDSLASLKCTRLVIAHRLSTIRECDRILVMDEGRIVADGPYEELVKTSPVFAELVERQSL